MFDEGVIRRCDRIKLKFIHPSVNDLSVCLSNKILTITGVYKINGVKHILLDSISVHFTTTVFLHRALQESTQLYFKDTRNVD